MKYNKQISNQINIKKNFKINNQQKKVIYENIKNHKREKLIQYSKNSERY